MLANKLLTQLNVLLLSIRLRGTRVDNLLPSLALSLALYTVSTLAATPLLLLRSLAPLFERSPHV